MPQYRAKQNEVLDAICYEHYGSETNYTEMVLTANPNLAELGTHLPIGTLINLPDIKLVETSQQIELWTGGVE
jgi:phage tail protein X